VATGADGIELDVRLDGSGRVVVFHDAELTRMTRGQDTRFVEAVPSAQLDMIRLLGQEPIPTLAAVLDWARHGDVRLNVEIKADLRAPATLIEAVLDQLQDFPDAPARVGLSSFDPRLVLALSRRQHRLGVGWLVQETLPPTTPEGPWRRLGACCAHAKYSLLDAARISELHALQLAVVTWTVDDASTAAQLARLGVDAIISNLPGRVRKSLG